MDFGKLLDSTMTNPNEMNNCACFHLFRAYAYTDQTQIVLKLLKLLSISKGWVGEWVRYPIWIETTKATIQKLRVYSKKSLNQTQTMLKLLKLLSISKGWVGEWVRYSIWIETTKATIQKWRVYSKKSWNQTQGVIFLVPSWGREILSLISREIRHTESFKNE